MGGVDDEPDGDVTEAANEAERVVRHRKAGHEAALRLAEQLDRPDDLGPHVEETEHRLAEDEDILDEIGSEDD